MQRGKVLKGWKYQKKFRKIYEIKKIFRALIRGPNDRFLRYFQALELFGSKIKITPLLKSLSLPLFNIFSNLKFNIMKTWWKILFLFLPSFHAHWVQTKTCSQTLPNILYPSEITLEPAWPIIYFPVIKIIPKPKRNPPRFTTLKTAFFDLGILCPCVTAQDHRLEFLSLSQNTYRPYDSHRTRLLKYILSNSCVKLINNNL